MMTDMFAEDVVAVGIAFVIGCMLLAIYIGSKLAKLRRERAAEKFARDFGYRRMGA